MIEKKFIFLFILITSCHFLSNAQQNFFSNLRGISNDDKSQSFELGGMSIELSSEPVKLNDEGIKIIKEKYNIKNITKEYKDSSIIQENLVLKSLFIFNNDTTEVLYYFLLINDNNLDIIHFFPSIATDTTIIESFLNSYFNNELSNYIAHTQNEVIKKFNFLGRTIHLDGDYTYSTVNNIDGKNNDGISWTIFESEEKAKQYKNELINFSNNNNVYKLINDSTINIKFEGIKTSGRRIIYKTLFGDISFLGKKYLYLYYITLKIRGYYTTSILTYYSNDIDDTQLTPLLKKVMSLE